MEPITITSAPKCDPLVTLPPDSHAESGQAVADRLFASMASWTSLTDLVAVMVNSVMLAPTEYASCGSEDIAFEGCWPNIRPYLQSESRLGRGLLEELLTQAGFTFIAPGGRTWAVRSPDSDQSMAFAVSRRRGLKVLDPKYRQRRCRPGRSKLLSSSLLPSQELAVLEMHDDCADGIALDQADSAMRLLLYARDKFLKHKTVQLSLQVQTTLTELLGEPPASLYPPVCQHLLRWLSLLRTIYFGQVVLWRGGWKPVCVQKWRAVTSIDWVSADSVSFTIDPRTVDALRAFSWL